MINCALTKGVLLYGPPGCGKTMIAKATAREAGMNFLYLDVSLLTDKLYGESAKLAGAVFSLAQKLQPTIIFIDEIDCFLRSRNKYDNEASAMMKAQFMMLWDGLTTDPKNIVIIMGATNRPSDLDPAILRRMPATFKISLPEQQQRKEILTLILNTEKYAKDVDFDKLAALTNHFSGSDLKELCRDASLSRFRDLIKEEELQKKYSESHLSDSVNLNRLRPINMNDLIASVEKTKASKKFTDTYIRLGVCAPCADSNNKISS
ncbi:ATPase, AAA-type, core,ATPase, AAA-type, conserved site,P-loop containing nucleoside triphosphate [Cinara cedri]|uniref:ATPase, AAA-type, core,ATPase, AAA-type, conserved site,P-loop containing nucleoside triphosphate n=1 Tax=Cinara cedri TaxID=506608 RepID=A0A5E4MC14_9HEMI|nr:ATPase, AAA-type, core,ATPase, AAA-type, conserved site,P-loop containing nucleoside triphosphate [Cinara cedri]